MTATRQRDKAAASPYQAYASTDCQSGRRSAPRRPLWTLLEENERTPAGNNMPQIPGFAILIADARAHALPAGSVLDQIAHHPRGAQSDDHRG
jgi:hypothetical protein